ncbi:uncharacterized protein LOC123225723 [Mangifera indica]|uniref:uncharacterized protein LOC123225723 n=1 Tax=Mangifera indica TaxID=29780 RepID=UPI001CFB58AA|nr:uncharacterized protein LOC123225723 [Mangifera indica]
MGEQKEAPKNDGAKKDDGVVTVVLKMELHCEGCAKKVRRAVRHYEGVQSVKTGCDANKVTVVGKVNPVKMKERLEEKMKKKVGLIYPQLKKDLAAGGRDKKPSEKKPPKEQKEAPKNDGAKKDEGVVTVVLEMDCEGCAEKLKDAVKGYQGVQSVKTGCDANKVTVVGKVNPVKMKERLEEKMKKKVGLIYPQLKKDLAAGGRDKKPSEKKPPKEQKEAPKNDGAKKDEGVVTVVLEMDCEGCAEKLKDAVKGYQGVQSVKTGCDANKVTVVGKVNPVKMEERLEEKMKKKVGLIYPQPKKDLAAGGRDKKPSEKKPPKEQKEAPKNDGAKKDNFVLKMELHCEGCPKEVQVKVKFCVQSLKTDCDANKVTVVGKVDPVKMKERLEEKNEKESVSPRHLTTSFSLRIPILFQRKMIVVIVFLLACVSSVLGLFYPSQEKEAPKNDDAKKDDGVVTVVLKMELRCERCAKEVKDAVKGYKGVQLVKTDCDANKVTVVGEVDPANIKEILEEKTKKEVELISPKPKKDDGVVTVVLEMHCEGCAMIVKRAVRSYKDVQPVNTDCDANKVTVVGKVDPVELKKRLQKETKKKVELISTQPKKDAATGGGDKNPEEKKPEKKKAEEKKPPKERTDVLKIRLHPDDCIWGIMDIIRKFDGVDKVTADRGKNLVTVKGTVDIKQVRDLKDKLKGNVEIVPAKGGGKKKDKKAADKAKKRRTRKLLLHGLWRVAVAVAVVVAHFL